MSESPVSDYIATVTPTEQSILTELMARALELVPNATEGSSYGMPALKYRGRPLISVVATKKGFSLFPFSSEVIKSVAADLDGYAITKGGFKFTDDKQVPDFIYDRVVQGRRAEIDQAIDS